MPDTTPDTAIISTNSTNTNSNTNTDVGSSFGVRRFNDTALSRPQAVLQSQLSRMASAVGRTIVSPFAKYGGTSLANLRERLIRKKVGSLKKEYGTYDKLHTDYNRLKEQLNRSNAEYNDLQGKHNDSAKDYKELSESHRILQGDFDRKKRQTVNLQHELQLSRQKYNDLSREQQTSSHNSTDSTQNNTELNSLKSQINQLQIELNTAEKGPFAYKDPSLLVEGKWTDSAAVQSGKDPKGFRVFMKNIDELAPLKKELSEILSEKVINSRIEQNDYVTQAVYNITSGSDQDKLTSTELKEDLTKNKSSFIGEIQTLAGNAIGDTVGYILSQDRDPKSINDDYRFNCRANSEETGIRAYIAVTENKSDGAEVVNVSDTIKLPNFDSVRIRNRFNQAEKRYIEETSKRLTSEVIRDLSTLGVKNMVLTNSVHPSHGETIPVYDGEQAGKSRQKIGKYLSSTINKDRRSRFEQGRSGQGTQESINIKVSGINETEWKLNKKCESEREHKKPNKFTLDWGSSNEYFDKPPRSGIVTLDEDGNIDTVSEKPLVQDVSVNSTG